MFMEIQDLWNVVNYFGITLVLVFVRQSLSIETKIIE